MPGVDTLSWITPATNRPSAALGLTVSVRARGRGIIILSGPSSCGKGVVAEALRRVLQVPESMHVSMGDALRRTVERARVEPEFRRWLKEACEIGHDVPLLDPALNPDGRIVKARAHEAELKARFGPAPTQLDWLDFCVSEGLLVPDRWSERIIEGRIAELASRHEALILLDGYPRTEVAARHVLELSSRHNIPIIKVVHLSVSRKEMARRALGRQRSDDTPEKLERRYSFYVDQVQPSLEYLKARLGSQAVVLIDAHQPEYGPDGQLDLARSVRNVANSVLMAIGVSRHILEHLSDEPLVTEDAP